MLTLPSSVRVYVATRPFDLRKSFDGLAAAVISVFGGDPVSGHLYVFWNKRGHLVRVIFWDRTGYVVVSKRLARGRFAFVQQLVSDEPCLEMDAMELSLILEGIDLSEAKRRKRWRPPKKPT
jgi:transposase